MLGRKQPPLQVAGEAVGAVGRLLEQRDALAGRVLHAPVVVDIAEQEIAALLPPNRPFSRPEIAAKAGGERLERLRRRDDLVEFGRELLDLPCRSLRERTTRQRKPAGRARCLQEMST